MPREPPKGKSPSIQRSTGASSVCASGTLEDEAEMVEEPFCSGKLWGEDRAGVPRPV